VQRVLEPELMDESEQALAYSRADFEEPNAAFCAHVEQRLGWLGPEASVVDLGCGPGDIVVRLAKVHRGWRFDAVDGSQAMLMLAQQAIDQAELSDRVRLVRCRLQELNLPAHSYDAVISNSLLHHLHEPELLWREVARLGRDGAGVLIVDLRRPDSPDVARRIVERYSPNEPAVLKQDFYNSLCAAFTPAEVRAALIESGLGSLSVTETSDRHLMVHGRLAARAA
jgi:ubiquinone/menaquinone biosynthesis C-methylase UbiE